MTQSGGDVADSTMAGIVRDAVHAGRGRTTGGLARGARQAVRADGRGRGSYLEERAGAVYRVSGVVSAELNGAEVKGERLERTEGLRGVAGRGVCCRVLRRRPQCPQARPRATGRAPAAVTCPHLAVFQANR